MRFEEEIKLLAEGMDIDDTIRTICPQCNGGSTKEKSFSISIDRDGILYNCYRSVNCGLKGVIKNYDKGYSPSLVKNSSSDA